MRINVDLNEVLYGYINQLLYVYNKYIGPLDLDQDSVKSLNLIEYFPFESEKQLNDLIFQSSLEILGHGDQMSDGLMGYFNTFLNDIDDESEHSVKIVSRVADKGVPATLFFLSKTGCKCNHIQFYKNTVDLWDGCDILISANPLAIENKPSGCISVKIKTSYNENVKADYELENLSELLKNTTLQTQIFNTKIAEYEKL